MAVLPVSNAARLPQRGALSIRDCPTQALAVDIVIVQYISRQNLPILVSSLGSCMLVATLV